MRTLGILIMLLIYSPTCIGQNNVFNNASLFNYFSLNSAYAGSKNVRSLAVSVQKQWFGIAGAPSSQYITFHDVLKPDKLGYGFQFDHDKIGVHRRLTMSGTIAYHTQLNFALLSFGMDLRGSQYSYDIAQLNFHQEDGILSALPSFNQFGADASFSFLLQNDRSIFGLKASNLLQNQYSFNNNFEIIRERIAFDLLIGKAYSLNKKIALKPFLIGNYTITGQYFYDLSLNLSFEEKVTFGISYRNDKNVNLLGHFFVSKNLRIGYSYELGLMELRSNNPNSLELFLGMNIGKNEGEIVSPRFFSL